MTKEALAQPDQSTAGYCKKIEELIVERDHFKALAQPVQAANEAAPLEHVATVAVTHMRVDVGWLKAVPHNTKLFVALPLPPTRGGNYVEVATGLTEAKPEQEPVAWMVYTQDGQSVYVTDNPTDIQEGQRALPLYTTPPQRKPLTDELYNELLFAVGKKYPNETRHQTALRYIQQAEICAVEQGKAAHNIGDKT